MEIDIKHIAKLARLKIEDERVPKFEKDMQEILDLVEKLPSVSSESFGVDESNPMVLREDIPRESLRRDKFLANAPQTQAGCVVVPKTVE